MTRSNVMRLTGFSALISVLALRALSFSFSAIHFSLAATRVGHAKATIILIHIYIVCSSNGKDFFIFNIFTYYCP